MEVDGQARQDGISSSEGEGFQLLPSYRSLGCQSDLATIKGGPVNNAIRFFAGPGCNECDDRLVTGGHVLQFVVGTIF